jgi:hypothetical protein
VSLYSWEYSDETGADELFRHARASVACSVALFAQLAAGALPQTFHHAKAAAFLFELSLEQFLKASLALAGNRPPASHDLQPLYNRYRKLYPGKRFAFDGRVDDAVRKEPARPADQFLRYPTDRAGQTWEGNQHFSLEFWRVQVSTFERDYARLEPLLRARHQSVIEPETSAVRPAS